MTTISPKLLIIILSVVLVAVPIFQVVDGIECYKCSKYPGSVQCGGKEMKKAGAQAQVQRCADLDKGKTGNDTLNSTMCFSAFDDKDNAVVRGCLDAKQDVQFRGKTCIEKNAAMKNYSRDSYPSIPAPGFSTACACKKSLCNGGFKEGAASGIELKTTIILGLPTALFMIQHIL